MRDATDCRAKAKWYRTLLECAPDEWAAAKLAQLADAYEKEARRLERKPRGKPDPRDREKILAALLRKRAAAHNHGMPQQEKMLREQIAWSLPVQHPKDEEE